MTRRWPLSPGGSITFIALTIRLVYLYQSSRNPVWMIPTIDAATYHEFARQWVETGLRNSTTAWHAAGYPLFLSLVYFLAGPSIIIAKLAQAMIGAATCGGLATLATRVFDRRAGWIAGLGAALYGPLMFYEGELVSAGWSVTWSLLVLAFLTLPAPGRTRLRGAVAGLLAAGAALIRPELFFGFVAGLSLWFALGWFRKVHPQSWNLPAILTGTAVFLLLVFPIGKFNQRFTGTLSWFPANRGLNLYLGNAPDLCQTLTARPGPDYDRFLHLPQQAGHFSTQAQNEYYQALIIQQVRENPARFLRNLLWKAGLLISSREITADLDVYTARQSSGLLSLLTWKVGWLGFPLALLVPAVILIRLHPHRTRLGPVAIVYGVTALVMILLHPSARYRLLFLPPLLLCAGGGVSAWIAACRQFGAAQCWKKLLPSTAILLLTAGIPPTCLDTIPYTAERYRMIGQSLLATTGSSSEWLQRALELNPDDPVAHFFLGLEAWQHKDAETANRHLSEALALTPDYAMAHLLQAEMAEQANDLPTARTSILRALDSQPDQAEAHYRLARLLIKQQDLKEARYHLEQSLRFDPWHPQRHLDLAALLIDMDDPGEALILLEQLIPRYPREPGVFINAGLASQAIGKTGIARSYFMEAIRLSKEDPTTQKWLEEQLRDLETTLP